MTGMLVKSIILFLNYCRQCSCLKNRKFSANVFFDLLKILLSPINNSSSTSSKSVDTEVDEICMISELNAAASLQRFDLGLTVCNSCQ